MYQKIEQLEDLTEIEVEAAKLYQADAVMFHAMAQGWLQHFPRTKDVIEFEGRCSALTTNLSSAMRKFAVREAGVTYFGNGRGLSTTGALHGRTEGMVGMSYAYPGFTSTSVDIVKASSFLSDNVYRPVLVEFEIVPGQLLLPMAMTGQDHESELLLPTNAQFVVREAKAVKLEWFPAYLHLKVGRAAEAAGAR